MAAREILDGFRDSIVNLDIEGVQEACKDALESGIPPYKAIVDGMAGGMESVLSVKQRSNECASPTKPKLCFLYAS